MSTEARHRLYVCWSLNNPGNEQEVRELSAAIARQRDIPGVLSIQDGPRTRQVDWEGPEDSFDYAMTLTFDTFDSVRAYPPHPIHQDLVALILRIGSDIKGFWIDL
ncbi:Dabb family protein [Amycolatopsis jejuensis]|uniref:Dabb family protein n=1 Tax=Amycolatopsis jejuensis TaxID=330084 RepID=UPI000526F9F3|nr:Dabb family protein [Amycolatopsis jejuensis]